ncbi:MAG: GGDEF domain-containing protein [Ktedonobacteraceae bacterium]
MKDTHLRERLVSFGLIAVLLLLTVSSIGATLITQNASLHASEAVHMNDLYQQAHYDARVEDASMHEYILDLGSDDRAEFLATALQLRAELQTIAHDGDASDRAFVQLVLTKHARFLVLANQFFTLLNAHNLAGAVALHDGKIDPIFDPMVLQLGTATDEDHQLATRSLAALESTQQVVIVSTALMFMAGLFLLTVFWKAMRGYQRQLDKATQAELLRMEQAALTDPLTGLPNHRTMMDQIEGEISRCRRTQQSCAIVFVDLDHFKHINDTWGHRAGDAVLREVSRRLKKSIRQGDSVGRYGGEEFVIVLTNTNLPAARQAAERLRVAFASAPCSLESEENALARSVISLTASIGVAVYNEHGTTREALIEAADHAMYNAKQMGRNRVCLAGEETALTPQVLASMP